jgi:hypothetical protein
MRLSNFAKKVLGIVVVAGVLAGIMIPVAGVAANPPQSVTVTTPSSVAPGQTFNVTLDINTTSQVRGWQFDVTYDPAVLTYNAPPVEGPFIKTFAGAGNTYFNPGTATSGAITAFANAQTGGPAGGATGTGTLVTLSFTVAAGVMPTASSIHIVAANSSLADQNSNPINGITYVDGTVNVIWPAPAITSFTPTFGGNGVNITITGTDLTGATAVSFGGVAATSIVSNTATTIVAKVATGATGSVSVTNPGGTATKTGFTFVAAPIVSSIAPATGTTGTAVTVTGSGFATVPGNVQSVTIGGTALASVVTVNDTTITGVIAAGTPVSATDAIVVTTFGGASNSNVTFNYVAPGGSIGLTPASQTISSFVTPFSINVIGDLQSPTATARGWSAVINYDPTKVTFVSVAASPDFLNFASVNGMTAWMSPASVDATHGTVTIGGAFLGGSLGMHFSMTNLAVVNFAAVNTDSEATLPVNVSFTVSNQTILDTTGTAIANVTKGLDATAAITVPSNPLPTTPADQTATMNIPATLAPTLTFIAPWDATGWNLVPSQKNTAQRTMTVFSNANWTITARGTNGGYMANGTQLLATPLTISATAGTGTGYSIALTGPPQVLATGNPNGQNFSVGGDLRTLTLTQPVLYTDKPSITGYYSITTTFTASVTGW